MCVVTQLPVCLPVCIPVLCACPSSPSLQVIQPVFNLMAEQICLMGDMGESPALQLGYDDFNESACMPQVAGCAQGCIVIELTWHDG